MHTRISTYRIERASKMALAALCVAFALALCALCAPAAFADQTSVQTAQVTATYENPETGQIEDSAGESQVDLGQSMVESTTNSTALVEVDETGQTYVTLRFNLMNEITQVTIEDEVNGTFQATEATEMQRQATSDGSDSTGDYRFAVDSTDDLLRVSLYVDPMGRSVIYFVHLSALTDGNSDGFIASVTPGVEIASASSDAADSADASASNASSEESAEPSAEASDDASADSGVKEYNAEGDQVQDDGSSDRVPVAPVLVGIVVVAAIIIAICLVKNRSKREAADTAAAAAAATAAQPKAKPSSGASKNDDK